MAIVHPAFCVVGHDSMEPITTPEFRFSMSGPNATVADTKHFKNRVYSSRTADVFSASINATRQ
jgi:hypothetical protein